MGKFLMLFSMLSFLSIGTSYADMDPASKAIRPSVGAPLVGPGSCDLASVKLLLQEIDCTLEECCDSISSISACCEEILVTLTECCEEIITTITTCCERLEANFCDATLITQADVDGVGFVITVPGVYRLAEDIVYTGAGNAITIATNDVELDLACFTISTSSGANGVFINPGLVNVQVRNQNGRITGFSTAGIQIGSGASRIQILDIEISNCGDGIFCNGAAGSGMITLLDILRCDFISNTVAIRWAFVRNSSIQDCRSHLMTEAGILLNDSTQNRILNCSIQDITSSTSAFGMSFSGGSQNLIRDCYIADVTSTSAVTTNQAAGIAILTTEQQDTFENNTIARMTALSGALPVGINLAYSTVGTLGTTGLPGITFDTPTGTLGGTEWTPDGRYLAVSSTSTLGETVVYELDDSNLLTRVAQFNYGNLVNNSDPISWSPDGKYLAVCGQEIPGEGSRSGNILYFNGTSLVSVATFDHGAGVSGIDWSPNGRWVAIAGDNDGFGSFEVRVYEFTEIIGGGGAMVLIDSVSISPGTVDGISIDWSPDSRYLVTGQFGGAIGGQVYSFDGSTITFIDDYSRPGVITRTIAKWAPNGRFFAVGNAEDNLTVFSFNGTTATLLDTISLAQNVTLLTVEWSPDGRFIAVGGNPTGALGGRLRLFSFNGTSLADTGLSYDHDATINGISWNRNGALLAFAGETGIGGFNARVLRGLVFQDDNMFLNNVVSDIHGPALAAGQPGFSTGVGMQVSTAENLAIGTTSFNNDNSYTFVALERYQEFLVNIRFRNEFPNKLSNVLFPPL